MRLLALLALTMLTVPAWAQVTIDHPWARATPPGAKIGAGYMLIRNKSASPDRLLAARSPLAAHVETHVHLKEGNVVRMREVKGYDIPANGTFELKPGGAHLMLVDIKRPFKEGEAIPVVLVFQRAGEIKAELHVAPLGAAGPAHTH